MLSLGSLRLHDVMEQHCNLACEVEDTGLDNRCAILQHLNRLHDFAGSGK
jgi:hypothetical protein